MIAADSRSHGHSENGAAPLKYEQIADDLAELVRSLGIERIDVLGHSDGGNVALLLAIRHPSQIGKVVASSPNLRPGVGNAGARVREQYNLAAKNLESGDHSQDWARVKMQREIVLTEPHITQEDLQKIAAPTLIVGADHDIMPLTHFLEIWSGIPHAQLAILPGATHGMIRQDDDLYNFIVKRFLDVTFVRSQGR